MMRATGTLRVPVTIIDLYYNILNILFLSMFSTLDRFSQCAIVLGEVEIALLANKSMRLTS